MPLVVGILCGDALPFPYGVPLWAVPLSGLLCLVAGMAFHKCRWLYGAGVCLFFFGVGHASLVRQLERVDYVFSGEASTCEVYISEEPEAKERSVLCRVLLTKELRGDTLLPCPGEKNLLLYFPKDSVAAGLCRGMRLWVHARLSPPANNGNPDEFDYVRYLKHKGVAGTAYVASGHWRVMGMDDGRSLRQTALDCREKVVELYRDLGFGGDELAVLSALTVGDKEELGDDIVETYSVSGASHVLALSGLHIGFIYALLLFVCKPLWKRCRYLKPFLLLLIVAFLWGFAFLTGLSSSVVRSVIMFSLLAVASLQPEKPLAMNTLAATAFLMLLYNPVWLFDVGFQLSFVAVAAILVFQPRLYSLLKVENRWLRYVWGLVTVSVAAQIGTAPLVIFYFSRFSTHFLLTNLWVIPMVSLVLYSAVLLLLLTPFPAWQQAFSVVVKELVHTQNEVLRWIEHLPYSSLDGISTDVWEVLLFYLLLGLMGYALMRRTPRNVCLFLLVMLLAVSYHSALMVLHVPQRSIVFYNVRGCPAVHCMTDGSKSWLVCADSLPDVSRLNRSLSAHWSRLRLQEPRVVTGDYSAVGFSIRNQMLCYAGRRVCLLHDARWKNKTAIHPIPVDYLYISKGYEGGIREFSSLFSVRTVVLDASLPGYYQERIINECISLGISYFSLSEKGSVCILL